MNGNDFSIAFDEAGRGSIFGPVFVGAVAFPSSNEKQKNLLRKLAGIKDSKKLSEKERLEWFKKFPDIFGKENFSFGLASNEEINSYGISEAIRKASLEALKKLPSNFTRFYFDGFINLRKDYPKILQFSEPKLDENNPFCSASSIIAKVKRDEFILSLESFFNEKWEVYKNKGYGTKKHFELIKENGISNLHRKSFLAKFFEEKKELKIIGNFSFGKVWEKKTCEKLIKLGHKILETNFEKVGVGEVDIISEKDNEVFFWEVKFRSNKSFGEKLGLIDKRKLERIKKVAEIYISQEREKGKSWKGVFFKAVFF